MAASWISAPGRAAVRADVTITTNADGTATDVDVSVGTTIVMGLVRRETEVMLTPFVERAAR